MNKKYIVGLGEILWDMLPDGRKLGGAPANFAHHISQFNLPSCVVSAIGKDALGDEIKSIINSKKQDSIIEPVNFPTGTVEVSLDNAGIPKYDITENVAWDNIPFTKRIAELAQNTCAVCFGSLAQRNQVSRTTINRFIDAIPDDDGKPLIIFDINLRQNFFSRDILHESIKRCNILKINDEELKAICGIFNITGNGIQETCRKLITEFNLKLLILTCGTNGSHVFSQNTSSFLPTPKVEIADTVGAGDSFTAAFVAALTSGKCISDAHLLAVETSAFVCSRFGAMPQLPEHITNSLSHNTIHE